MLPGYVAWIPLALVSEIMQCLYTINSTILPFARFKAVGFQLSACHALLSRNRDLQSTRNKDPYTPDAGPKGSFMWALDFQE